MFLFYQVLVHLARWVLPLAAPFHPRLRAWLEGRKQPVQKKISGAPVWFHCASLGEFEQARPLIELIKQSTDKPVLLTFFSPSGYRVRKNYAFADQVEYLPLDTPAQAHHFVNTFSPCLLILVKYDFWYNHLRACYRRQIPVILISGLFRPGQYFFRWYGRPFLHLLRELDHFFVQDQQSAQWLRMHGFTQVTQAGDTRIDRVMRLPQENKSFIQIEEFAGAHPLWIWGSTWPEDEALLFPLVKDLLSAGWKVIIAPHDIGEDHLVRMEKLCPVTLTRISSFHHGTPAEILLVDNIGLLAYLYRYARLVYIGGGFGRGIHNVLEPMAFAVPVIFGPQYQEFKEAMFLVDHAAGRSVRQLAELQEAWHYFQDDLNYQQAQEMIRNYLQEHAGATSRIYTYLAPRLAAKNG